MRSTNLNFLSELYTFQQVSSEQHLPTTTRLQTYPRDNNNNKPQGSAGCC